MKNLDRKIKSQQAKIDSLRTQCAKAIAEVENATDPEVIRHHQARADSLAAQVLQAEMRLIFLYWDKYPAEPHH